MDALHIQPPPLPLRTRTHTAPAIVRRTTDSLSIKRWDASQPHGTLWDGLRRDAELWSATGDCNVYLYARGQSQRSASFRISYQSLYMADCIEALHTLSSEDNSGRSLPSSTSSSGNTTPSELSTSIYDLYTSMYDLYLGAPAGLDRDETCRWHITTRNFFAWLQGKPLVGESLGWALVRLAERIQSWVGHEVDLRSEIMEYADGLGYLDFVKLPTNSLAMLHFAETYQDRTLWIDAFAHCVGMKEDLLDIPGYELISRKSKALMSRAALEMDLHICRATNSIATFLEEELSSTYLGLTSGARNHLETFRSFVNTFCIAKYGYWPVAQNGVYDREMLEAMLLDFGELYEYLADKASGSRRYNNATGGVCVLQNLEAFNTRHRVAPLPYSLPLIPNLGEHCNYSPAPRGLLQLRSSSKESKLGRIMTARHALENATNRDDVENLSCSFVQAYAQFEGELAVKCDDKVSIVEARKVRWILVYGMLQILTSITQTPPEVRQSAGAPYALCVLTEGCPPWSISSPPPQTPATPFEQNAYPQLPQLEIPGSPPTPLTDLQPDCENADYFAHIPRTGSDGSIHAAPIPPPRKSPMRRLTTLRRASIKLSKRPLSVRSRTTPTIPIRQQTPIPDSPASLRVSSYASNSPAPSLSWSVDGGEYSSSTEDEAVSPTMSHTGLARYMGLEVDIDALIAKAQGHQPDLKGHPAFSV